MSRGILTVILFTRFNEFRTHMDNLYHIHHCTDLKRTFHYNYHCMYKARHAHKRLYTVLPKYSKIQVLPGITSCRLMKYNKQAIELNSLLINNMPKDGYG